jgi:hypothetical protein
LAAAEECGVRLGGPKGIAPLRVHITKYGSVATTRDAKEKTDKSASEMQDFIGPYILRSTTGRAIATSLDDDGIETRRVGR